MKRFFGFLLDILFFISFLGVTIIGGLYMIYQQGHDISILNTYLQTDLIRTLLVVYSVYIVAHLLYFWIMPTLLKQTLGQRLAGMSFESEHKIGFWRVFLKSIIGTFWDIALFPYTLVMVIKKKQIISGRLSGIVVSKNSIKPNAFLYILSLIFTLFIVGSLSAGTYVYKTGLNVLMERYTNYESQTVMLIDKLAFQDASVALEKYKQQQGENNNYQYYHCLVEANLSTDLPALEICKKALESNQSDNTRVKAIISQQAKIYAANASLSEANTLYARLWNEFQDRSLDMKNYVVILSELGKGAEATTVLNEIAKQIPAEDVVALRDLGNLYERIGNADIAFEKYQTALSHIPEGENQALAGELQYNIGVLYYNKGKFTEATTAFEKAKVLNKDFAEPVESYIILISKLKNSVTK